MGLHTQKAGTTTALPAYSFNEDTNTGLASSAADQVELVAGGQVVFTGKMAGTAESYTELIDTKTAIANNSATDIITVTVPNADHAAMIVVEMLATIGGGGDNWESSRVAVGRVVVARTTGANAVAAVASIDQAQIATVSGGETITLAYGVGSVSGAVGATNTFPIQVTIARGGGTANAHQCVFRAYVINSNATGVTIAAA